MFASVFPSPGEPQGKYYGDGKWMGRDGVEWAGMGCEGQRLPDAQCQPSDDGGRRAAGDRQLAAPMARATRPVAPSEMEIQLSSSSTKYTEFFLKVKGIFWNI
jgi:hypothetical protein